jgi:hypothetical protein
VHSCVVSLYLYSPCLCCSVVASGVNLCLLLDDYVSVCISGGVRGGEVGARGVCAVCLCGGETRWV